MPPSTLAQQAIVATLLALCACRAREVVPPAAKRLAPSAAEKAYRPPPQATAIRTAADGLLFVDGSAWPLDRVRLAQPSGAALITSADRAGAWRLRLAPAARLRLFGLSMIEGGRITQAEGYLAIAPDASAAQLRAGAGAWVLGRSPVTKPQILALDFDRKGGAVVSGVAPPRSLVAVAVDGAQRGPVRAGPDGRFSLELDQPLPPGAHELSLGGGRLVGVATTPAGPIADAPFSAAPLAGGGWRIDWMTPGGGVQTTLLFR